MYFRKINLSELIRNVYDYSIKIKRADQIMHFYFLLFAVIQGLTEFIPVSSSAHIMLAAKVFGHFSVGRNYMVFLHFGSMLALIVYFRNEIRMMVVALLNWNKFVQYRQLALQIVVALLPTVFFGALIEFLKPAFLKNNTTLLLALNSIIFGVLLYVVDRYSPQKRGLLAFTFRDAFLVGLAQSVAFIEGASRSGMTITAARLLGFKRVDSMKFSFLLDIPTIFAASSLKLNFSYTDLASEIELYTFGVLAALVVSLMTISIVLKLLERVSFLPFAVYRVSLGLVLLYMYMNGYIT